MSHESDEKSLSLEEIFWGVWRRKKVALLITGIAVALGALYILVTPKQYVANAVVRVDMHRLPEQFVSPTVTELVQERLATVRHELLSRQVLAKVIEEFRLYDSIVASEGMDAAVTVMRGSLEVKVEGENAFLLSFQARDPELAARVANRLPAVYAEQALMERAEAAERAAAIFSSELERIRPEVERFEAQLTRFKTENAAHLPEVLESNIRHIDRLSGLTESTLMALADAQRRRTALARNGAESTVEVGRLAAISADRKRELNGLRALYTEGHPAVEAAKRAAAEAKDRLDEAARAAAEGDSEQKRVDGEIAWLKKSALDFQSRMDEFMKRVDATPAVGAQLAAINRDYDAVREKYQTLLSRKVEAELAKDLERRQKASMFRLVEEAFPPVVASEPNPTSALGMSLLLGLGLGIAFSVYLASRDTAIRGVADARRRLGLPVLASVPDLNRTIRRVS